MIFTPFLTLNLDSAFHYIFVDCIKNSSFLLPVFSSKSWDFLHILLCQWLIEDSEESWQKLFPRLNVQNSYSGFCSKILQWNKPLPKHKFDQKQICVMLYWHSLQRQGVTLFGLVSQRYTESLNNMRVGHRENTEGLFWQNVAKGKILRMLEKEISPSFIPTAFSVMREVMWLYVINNVTGYTVSIYKTD